MAANIIEKLNHYYKIDSYQTTEGLFELWESKKYGDTVSAIVTLSGEYIGRTWESLPDFYHNEWLEA